MKIFLRTLSLFLAVIMSTAAPLQTFAASENTTKYISEIVAVSAESKSEAKRKLEAAGYKMLDGNLNSTLSGEVYIGYKETADKKEAITDIAAMNMLGKFSYSDYERIMTEYKESIETTVTSIETFIEEYQQGYANRTKNAKLAYTALNLFSDDDSKKLMGDYFLDYDFSDESYESMTNTLMQANDEIVMSMIRALSFAGDPDDTTLAFRMSETGPNGLEVKYNRKYATHAAFEYAMATEYGKVADTLYKDWDFFYNYLLDIEKTVAVADENGQVELIDGAFDVEEAEDTDTGDLTKEQKEFLETVDTLTEIPEAFDGTSDFAFYTLLANTEYGDGTLLDFFKRPSSAVDKTELYVIADCMSDGQKKQVDFVGIKEILQSAFSADEEAEDEAVEQYEEFTENVNAVSIFAGVDRTVFEDGVAFTSSAVNYESLSETSFLDKLGNIFGGDLSYWNTTTITCWAATCALPAIGVGATFVRKSALKKLPNATQKLEAATATYEEQFKKYMDRWDGGNPTFSRAENEAGLDEMFPRYRNRLNRCTENYNSVQRTVKFTAFLKVASFVLLVVVLAYDIYTLVEYFTEEKPLEKNIPHHIMGTAMTAYGEDYVYYQTVKTLDGKAADINNGKADAKTGWLVLYTTKDADAGEAIRADDIKVVIGSKDFGEKASVAHIFNETAAVNLTSSVYTGAEDKVGGTYIVFTRNEPSAYTASAISGGVAAIIAAAALIVGATGGSIVTALIKKKKEKA